MGTDDYHLLRAMLEWQVDLGVTEAISDVPVNRYEAAAAMMAEPLAAQVGMPAVNPGATARPSSGSASVEQIGQPPTLSDLVAAAKMLAAAAADPAALRSALAACEGCELKMGARSLVFADGNPGARVMVIGEAPGREEDLQGLPFVGAAGQLLDKMFAAIGLSRKGEAAAAIYITNILPWRPPQNREPTPEEIAMMMPFVARHVALIDPEVVVVMGNTPLLGLLGRTGITKARGQWGEAMGRPVLPMFHPAYLLRNPAAKRDAWADLLALQLRLRG